MDFKNLSPAYLSSLGLIIVGVLMVGSSNTVMFWLGLLLLAAALALNVFSHLVTVSKVKGEPAPAVLNRLDKMENSLEQRFEAIREQSAERRDESEEQHDESQTANSETPPKRSVLPSKIEDLRARDSQQQHGER